MYTLQKLTNDKLVYSTEKGGSARVKIASLGKGGKTSGTRLIRRINSSKRTMTIVLNEKISNREKDVNRTNAKNGIGTDVVVIFNPTRVAYIPTLNPATKRVHKTTRPPQVGLGHEMIHGDRSMRGVSLRRNLYESHTYIDSSGRHVTEKILIDEAETIGLSHVGPDDITENDIRKEQGQNSRGAY